MTSGAATTNATVPITNPRPRAFRRPALAMAAIGGGPACGPGSSRRRTNRSLSLMSDHLFRKSISEPPDALGGQGSHRAGPDLEGIGHVVSRLVKAIAKDHHAALSGTESLKGEHEAVVGQRRLFAYSP